jgi:hypothetical protein
MARENSEDDGHDGEGRRPPRDSDTVELTVDAPGRPPLPPIPPDDVPDLPGLDELPDTAESAAPAPVPEAVPMTLTVTLSPELGRYLRLRAASRSIEPAVYLRTLLEEDRRRGIQKRIRELLLAGAQAPNEERTEADWRAIETQVRKRLRGEEGT